MFHILQIKTGGFDHNFSYLFWEEESRKGGLIDPCGSFEKIKAQFRQHCPSGLVLDSIFLTHSHRDHLDGKEEAKEFFKVEKIFGHPANPFVTHPLKEGEKIFFGKEFLTVLFTPGHTKDSIALLTSDFSGLFTGDTLFIDYCGFAEDGKALFHTLRNVIFPLPDEAVVFSGHDYGSSPAGKLGEEKISNPYLKAETEEEFLRIHALME